MEPARERWAPGHCAGLACQIREYDLRDILRPMRVAADLSQCRMINEPEMPLHNLGKCILAIFRGVESEQFGVIDHGFTQ